MAEYPPFMNGYGSLAAILNAIRRAQTPPKFTIDFLQTKLGFKSSSARAVIPLLKRLGFLAPDNSPTELYSRLRNTNDAESKVAMAQALRHGYAALFERNEYAHSMGKRELEGLIVQITGLDQGNATVRAILGSFEALKAFADFETKAARDKDKSGKELERESDADAGAKERGSSRVGEGLGVNLAYTINLNLPETTDVEVYDAIFRSLKEHMLKRG